jgi:hypothetical protein
MTADRTLPDEGACHSVEWYRHRLGGDTTLRGAQLMIPCDGGPSRATLERFPPGIGARGGEYVLDDHDPVHAWRCDFVSQFV